MEEQSAKGQGVHSQMGKDSLENALNVGLLLWKLRFEDKPIKQFWEEKIKLLLSRHNHKYLS